MYMGAQKVAIYKAEINFVNHDLRAGPVRRTKYSPRIQGDPEKLATTELSSNLTKNPSIGRDFFYHQIQIKSNQIKLFYSAPKS